jgi:hypothetical protein
MVTEVDRDMWMYATSVATIVQALSNEVAYWSGIGVDRWIALNTWSRSATGEARQTIKTLHKLLKPDTRHIALLNSHFFNIEKIEVNIYRSIIYDIVKALATMKEQSDNFNSTPNLESQMNVPRVKRRGIAA